MVGCQRVEPRQTRIAALYGTVGRPLDLRDPGPLLFEPAPFEFLCVEPSAGTARAVGQLLLLQTQLKHAQAFAHHRQQVSVVPGFEQHLRHAGTVDRRKNRRHVEAAGEPHARRVGMGLRDTR